MCGLSHYNKCCSVVAEGIGYTSAKLHIAIADYQLLSNSILNLYNIFHVSQKSIL